VDRHLLPDEIDSLLDGEVGFGTAPLKAHVRQCEACRGELEAARALVRQLEHLPRFAPTPLFEQRVMAQVQIFVPWHVTALDTVRGVLPQSRPGRALAGAGLLSTATAFSILMVWLLARLDTALFAMDLGATRVRGVIFGGFSEILQGALGAGGAQALLSTGPLGMLLALTVLLVLAAFTTRSMRALARAPQGG
jgi:hypothetical protein